MSYLPRDLNEEGYIVQTVDVSSGDTVHIQKPFGPWAVDDLWITLDYDKASWVIEKEDHEGVRRVIYQLVVDGRI